jgi:hypothetical protein
LLAEDQDGFLDKRKTLVAVEQVVIDLLMHQIQLLEAVEQLKLKKHLIQEQLTQSLLVQVDNLVLL